MEEIKMDRIEDAIADFKEGKFVIVCFLLIFNGFP